MEWISGILLYQPLPPNMQAAYLRESNGHTTLLIDVAYGAPAPTASNLYYGNQKNHGVNISVYGSRVTDPAFGSRIIYSTVQ